MAGWAWCCCNSRYYLRKFEADSGFLNVASADIPTSGVVGRELRLTTSNVFVCDFISSGSAKAWRYDLSLSLEQSFSPAGASPNFLDQYQFDVNSSGTVAFCVDDTTDKLESRSSTDTLNWTTAIDSSSESLYGCAIDSSGNVYAISLNGSLPEAYLYKFSSSGVKQWKSTIATAFNSMVYGIAVDSSDNPWVMVRDGSRDLVKYDSSGSVVGSDTVTASRIVPDSSGGMWLGDGFFSHYDSSVSLITSWSSGANGLFCVDSSDNVFIADQTARKVYKYNSSGSLQWTSGAIWTAPANVIPIVANNTHVFVSGTRV